MTIKKLGATFYKTPSRSLETKVFFNVLKNQVIILDPALILYWKLISQSFDPNFFRIFGAHTTYPYSMYSLESQLSKNI